MTEGYLGNQNLKPAGVEVPFSEEDVKEYVIVKENVMVKVMV